VSQAEWSGGVQRCLGIIIETSSRGFRNDAEVVKGYADGCRDVVGGGAPTRVLSSSSLKLSFEMLESLVDCVGSYGAECQSHQTCCRLWHLLGWWWKMRSLEQVGVLVEALLLLPISLDHGSVE